MRIVSERARVNTAFRRWNCWGGVGATRESRGQRYPWNIHFKGHKRGLNSPSPCGRTNVLRMGGSAHAIRQGGRTSGRHSLDWIVGVDDQTCFTTNLSCVGPKNSSEFPSDGVFGDHCCTSVFIITVPGNVQCVHCGPFAIFLHPSESGSAYTFRVYTWRFEILGYCW